VLISGCWDRLFAIFARLLTNDSMVALVLNYSLAQKVYGKEMQRVEICDVFFIKIALRLAFGHIEHIKS
jgi:hypothetical protein